MIGLASTPPVYSLVATLGFVVLAVGAQAPIVFIIAFVPMLFIAFAYRELNNAVPTAGRRSRGPRRRSARGSGGWAAGEGVAVAGMVVLANLAQIAAVYFWALFGIDLASNDWRIILVALFFIAAMTHVSWRGVEIGEKIQNVLLAVQYLALACSSWQRCGSSSAGRHRTPPPSPGSG